MAASLATFLNWLSHRSKRQAPEAVFAARPRGAGYQGRKNGLFVFATGFVANGLFEVHEGRTLKWLAGNFSTQRKWPAGITEEQVLWNLQPIGLAEQELRRYQPVMVAEPKVLRAHGVLDQHGTFSCVSGFFISGRKLVVLLTLICLSHADLFCCRCRGSNIVTVLIAPSLCRDNSRHPPEVNLSCLSTQWWTVSVLHVAGKECAHPWK